MKRIIAVTALVGALLVGGAAPASAAETTCEAIFNAERCQEINEAARPVSEILREWFPPPTVDEIRYRLGEYVDGIYNFVKCVLDGTCIG